MGLALKRDSPLFLYQSIGGNTMKKWIDLSYDIENEMPVNPYDEPVKLYQDKFLDSDSFNGYKLRTSMHAGTHIDAPMHLTESGRFINDYPLDRFVGEGTLLDLRGENPMTYREDFSETVKKGDIVLLHTDHAKHFGENAYYNEYPVIDQSLAAFFIDRGVKIVGMDTPSPDYFPFEIHKMLFAEGIFIIENLRNLHELAGIERFEVMAFPLKIKTEASVLRVVARCTL